MYEVLNINTISKFLVVFLDKNFKIPEKGENGTQFSQIFWNKILDKTFLKIFLLEHYLNNKKQNLSNDEYEKIKKDFHFIIDKLDLIKNKINFVNKNSIPKGNDVFFSFRLFSSILYYINDYFFDNHISLGLKNGVVFTKEISSTEDLLQNIKYYKQTDFIKLLIEPLIEKIVKGNEKIIYKFEIFRPNELLLVGIMGTLIKEKNNDAKIVIDLSSGNEQFDFNQWIDIIKKSDKQLFEYYDFFIFDMEFGFGIKQIQKYLNGKIENTQIQNIIFYEDKLYFNKVNNNNLTKNIFEEFILNTFNPEFSSIFGDRAVFVRFLPYKCYWNNCNFCAINSQNKFIYDEKYSYSFFVDKWIKYIKKYDIKLINFKDEAIHPKVIIKFAHKLIENNLKVNYLFRTRFDKLYTLKNCKILAKSGCSFCGIGLESAVDRVNEKIGNKGNKGISLKDKIRIIHNFDKTGVSFHNYSIMGFPGEIDIEATITYKFLKSNIINSNYYTCSPNIFGLMKGPKIFSRMNNFGVKVKKEDLDNPFKLKYEFTYKGKKRNFGLLKKFEENLYRIQSFPWIDKHIYINGREFGHYIDKSYIFYFLKVYHKKNPFYVYKNINNNIINKSIEEILNNKYKISNYYQIYEYKNDNNIYIYDWIGCKDTIINKKYKNLIINFNNNLLLKDNINKTNIKLNSEFEDIIFLLLKNRILIKIW